MLFISKLVNTALIIIATYILLDVISYKLFKYKWIHSDTRENAGNKECKP